MGRLARAGSYSQVHPDYILLNKKIINYVVGSYENDVNKATFVENRNYTDMIEFWKIASTDLRTIIKDSIGKKLGQRFNADLYYMAAINGIIDYKPFFDMFVKPYQKPLIS